VQMMMRWPMRLRCLRRAAFCLIGVVALGRAAVPNQSDGGFFDPTKIVTFHWIDRSGIPKPIDEAFIGSVENGIFAARKADRTAFAGSLSPQIKTPNPTTPLYDILASPTFHRSGSKLFPNCIAKVIASGSLAAYCKLMLPVVSLSSARMASLSWGTTTRQATSCFIFSVSNLAAAASFSNSAARTNALPAVSPAFMPSLFASATLPSTVSLYFSNASSFSFNSRLRLASFIFPETTIA